MSVGHHPAVIELDQVLSALRAARERSLLVPFVGAGLSRDYCRGWAEFVRALSPSLSEGSSETLVPEDLYRMADRAASRLRILPVRERIAVLKKALRNELSGSEFPSQARALMEHPWPLVISTNYDDILPSVRKPANDRGGRERPPRLLGRSRDDCAAVVRSLSTDDDPIVWYVQGFVPVVSQEVDDERRIAAMVSDVVLGHQNYQRAINAAPEFRRAFSEIFRRRSLLFIGSGLSESYFVNLIAETLHSLGPGSHPHFALFAERELNNIDPEFLSVRLGITPVIYGSDFGDLPSAISRITQASEIKIAPAAPMVSEFGYMFPCGRASIDSPTRNVKVRLRFGPLERPSMNGAVVLSGGRERAHSSRGDEYTWFGGPMAKSFFTANTDFPSQRYFEVGTRRDGRVFRIGTLKDPLPVFIATSGADQYEDIRDLQSIVEATERALEAVDTAGFAKVSMGVLSAGNRAPSVPIHSLAAQLCGIRRYLRNAPQHLRKVEISVYDRDVWNFVAAGRIQVLDLLTSDLARVLVRVEGAEGDWEEYALSVPYSEKVGAILSRYEMSAKNVTVRIRPRILLDEGNIQDYPIFPGMVIEVSPIPDYTMKG